MQIIDTDPTEYIFHLNFMTNFELVVNLRKSFKCKIIMVAHYTKWSFALLGDYSRLEKIWTTKQKELKTPFEKSIIKDFLQILK